jgi:hypothetical protein
VVEAVADAAGAAVVVDSTTGVWTAAMGVVVGTKVLAVVLVLVAVLVGAADSGRMVVTPVGLAEEVVVELLESLDELPLQFEPVRVAIVLSVQLLVPEAQPRRRLAISEE